MIGVIVPAHNEQAHLQACLTALRIAAAHPCLHDEAVQVHIVLDACDDQSEQVVQAAAALPMPPSCQLAYSRVEARNVGLARAHGAAIMLERGARWLAFTDADTRVAPDWLAAQLSLEADAVCGTVAVDDWSAHAPHAQMLREHFARTYNDADGHRHIHGANLGVTAAAYRRVGGFASLPCHEDVTLVAALEQCGARVAWSAAPRVMTSARTDARAREGFGDTLLAVVAAHVRHEQDQSSPPAPRPRWLVSNERINRQDTKNAKKSKKISDDFLVTLASWRLISSVRCV